MANLGNATFEHSAGGEMIRVAAGTFTMGSPTDEAGHRSWERQREVTITGDSYLGKTPVTQRQYDALTGTNPTNHVANGDAPIDSVNWEQATQFCCRLTELDRNAGVLADDGEYRLPSEAEWEYACRAGTSQPRHGSPLDVAWHHDNARDKPHAVGWKQPNAWGFHDMLGNVWEWCQDWFCRANPCRSARGGSYFNSSRFCRAAQRWGWNPHSRGRYSGFRLLAAPAGSVEWTLPLDDFPAHDRPPSIYDAICAGDFDLAQRVIEADPAAIESVDVIPPPLHSCIYQDKPAMFAWLLDHGADMERLEQDYGATPLICAVVMRHPKIIRSLVERGADATHAMAHAERGLAGEFEDDPRLDRDGYSEIVELLRQLGVAPDA